ncbi:MAG: FUSC family protein [Dysgonomonas sp.]
MKIRRNIRKDIVSIFAFRKSERHWHIPILAGISVGIPLLFGYLFDNLPNGVLASTSGLLILYIRYEAIANRMMNLMMCSFIFILSYFIGAIGAFNILAAPFVLSGYVFVLNLLIRYFKVKAPGNFFFILVVSLAICQNFDLSTIPERVGIITLGTISTCALAFAYSIFTMKNYSLANETVVFEKAKRMDIGESAILALFVGGSLMAATILKLPNPYWVPVSCAAVMQGATRRHIWERGINRIVGTFIGAGFAWFLLGLNLSALAICVAIILLQFIVEVLVVRQYAVAVIFITALTIFLAEGGNPGQAAEQSLYIRFFDIMLGCVIGAIGGWILYHNRIRQKLEKHTITT